MKREFISFYKQTILGPLWYIIQPLASSLVFLVVFTKIANVPTGELPPILFYLSGNLVWMFFSENLIKVSDTFIGNANIFGKVYFPRLTVPISVIFSGIIGLSIQLIMFSFFMTYYYINDYINIHWERIILFPLVVLVMMLITLSFGLIISSLTTKYRDLKFAVRFGIQLWMFASPVAYSSDIIPERYKDIYMLNPISPVIEGFRFTLLGANSISWNHVIINLFTVIILLIFSILLFNKVEKDFMDTV